MCTVLTACSAVRYHNAAVRIVRVYVNFLQLVVLYGTVLQQYEWLNMCTVLMLIVLYGTVLQQ